LREDGDGGEPTRVASNCGAETDLGLAKAVIASLAGPMQEQDHGPAIRERVSVRSRDEDLIPIRVPSDGDDPIEKPRDDVLPGQRPAWDYEDSRDQETPLVGHGTNLWEERDA
jgi:hypothetical protein